MQILLVAVSLIWLISGFLLFSHPQSCRDFCRKALPAPRIKRLWPVPAMLGAVLLGATAYTPGLRWPLLVVGTLSLVKGLYLYRVPEESLLRILDNWLFMADEKTLKRHAIVLFVAGTALLAFVA